MALTALFWSLPIRFPHSQAIYFLEQHIVDRSADTASPGEVSCILGRAVACFDCGISLAGEAPGPGSYCPGVLNKLPARLVLEVF